VRGPIYPISTATVSMDSGLWTTTRDGDGDGDGDGLKLKGFDIGIAAKGDGKESGNRLCIPWNLGTGCQKVGM